MSLHVGQRKLAAVFKQLPQTLQGFNKRNFSATDHPVPIKVQKQHFYMRSLLLLLNTDDIKAKMEAWEGENNQHFHKMDL